jgi:hypothetical protein
MIYYHLPGLFEYFDFYQVFIKIFQTEPHKFRDVKIASIYGAPPNCLWAGGRTGHPAEGNIFKIMGWLHETGMKCDLVFSNCLLEPQHFSDKYCNTILHTFHESGNNITVYSDDLKNYIHTNFPEYTFTSSTTKCIKDKSLACAEADTYDLVVLDYNFNYQEDFLKSIDNKEKFELLVNSVCTPNCPQRFEHYTEISEFALGIRKDHKIFCPCQQKKFWEILNNPTVLKLEDIYRYEKMGFSHFKIEGRTTPYADLVEILVYYMVKPEYQLEIRQRLMFC